jgi:predicted ATPase/class 3 adenylate cyclase
MMPDRGHGLARSGARPPVLSFPGRAMTTLPSGTVTFLFTDVEGSTRLLRTLGPGRYRKAVGDHRRLLREAFTGYGGAEVDAEGDAFFVAFRRASDGVQAAAAAQRALASHRWPEGERLRVRMGLHTGEATLVSDSYVGLAVHRTARIADAAHGGQVLLSHTTCEVLGEDLPHGLALKDLGDHRLKDLLRAERLYQLLIDGLPVGFPPVRTLKKQKTNLPIQATPLVGRRREVAEVEEVLLSGRVRLLTLTGPGGTGKTRLALQVTAEAAERFEDGVYFATLAHLEEPLLVLPTIAQTLDLKETSGQPLAETVKEHLLEKHLLLVLDNFEHLLDAGVVVAELLTAAPRLRILVTSRSPLHVSGEHEYQVLPLALPDLRRPLTSASLTRSDAAALFMERAQAVRSGFSATNDNAEAIAEICAQLDGLPLAIELAAARIRILPPAALLRRLEQRLKLLTGGARDLPTRQQTLDATIEWSYRLLAEEEQRLFARLGVFAGGFSFEACEAICDPDGRLGIDVFEGISSLVEKALIRQGEGPHGEPRFTMLRTIREYALHRLEESGDAEELHRRHAGYFGELAEQAGQELRGAEEVLWLESLGAEHDNLRAALSWCGATGEAELQLRMGAALWMFWLARGYLSEGASWLQQALSAGEGESPRARAHALLAAASLEIARGNLDAMTTLAEEGRELGEELGDSAAVARSLTLLAVPAVQEGDLGRARGLYEASVQLARASGDSWVLAVALNNLGNLGLYDGDLDGGVRVWQEALAVCREMANADMTGTVLTNLGFAALAQRREHDAGALFRESLELFRGVGGKHGISYDLEGLAAVAASGDEPERAARLLGAAGRLREETGIRLEPFESRIHERSLASVRGDLGDALSSVEEEGRALPLDRAVEYALQEPAITEQGGRRRTA